MSYAHDCTLFVGDYGVRLGFNLTDCGDHAALNVGAPTGLSVSVRFRRPDGTTTDVAATFADFDGATGDGADGRVMVVVPSAGFLNQKGRWQAQAVVSGPTVTYRSTVANLIFREAL